MEKITMLVCASRESTLHDARASLLCEADIKLLTNAFNESDTVRFVRAWRPDVLLLDAVSFKPNAITTLDRTHALSPGTKTLLFSATCTDQFVVRALKHGASGCLRIGTSAHEILCAIRAVHTGELWAARKIVSYAFRELLAVHLQPVVDDERRNAQLSPRQLEIVAWMRHGMTNKEIARKLGISDMTVKTHAHNIFHKLEVSGRVRLLGLSNRPVMQANQSVGDESDSVVRRFPRMMLRRTPATSTV